LSSGVKITGQTRRAALKEAVTAMKAAGVDMPVLDARLIVQHVLGIDWNALFLQPDRPLADDERARLDAALSRRAAFEPVSRIVGRRHFWTLDLAVSPATLDPRADTETVIEAIVTAIPDRTTTLRILDFGTGTGALLLALLAEYPNATGVGVDLSAEAADVARGNAASHNLAARATFVVCHWAAAVTGQFDLIVSNPPYIPHADLAGLPPDVRDYDPHLALNGGADGLDAYREIFTAIPALLAPEGLVAVEIGAGQSDAVSAIAQEAGLVLSTKRADFGGIERALLFKRAGAAN
jgi:release factor glutamine methyltransferase